MVYGFLITQNQTLILIWGANKIIEKKKKINKNYVLWDEFSVTAVSLKYPHKS